jgi:hypothetical protein
MVKTLVRASHRKYKKNARGGKRTKRGRIMKKSKRMRSSSRKRVTMRRHMRNKRGGLPRSFQNKLLVQFKELIEGVPKLAECLKNFKEGKTPFNKTNSTCIDDVVKEIGYSNNDGEPSLRWSLEHLPEKDLLMYIDEDTKEGTNFYKYVLFKMLAEKEDRYETNDPYREDNKRFHPGREEWAIKNLASLKTELKI